MKYVIYDIETLKNLFTATFLSYDSKKKKVFVFYDDINQFFKFLGFLRYLKINNCSLVGFNNINFDNQILEFILDSAEDWWTSGLTIQEIVTEIYNEAQRLINIPDEERYKSLISDSKFTIPAIDIFKQKHYDGKAKMGTSLKWLQFTMNYWNVEEMPIEHDEEVSKEMIESVLSYNWNDVDSTCHFFEKNLFETNLRKVLSEKYGLNLINASEPKIAKDVFGKFLSEAMGITYKELKQLKTVRDLIKVKEIIFPYTTFKDTTLNNLLDTLNKTVLRPEDEFEKVFKVGNLEVTFGLGGLHSNNKPLIVSASNSRIIKTCDVKSMYPNLAIRNKLKPEHLGDVFLTVYENIYDERISIPKSDPINYVLKIILNSTYGLSGEPNSYLFDVQFTRAICINGQLSLLMLADMLKEKIPGIEFIMMNTDGMEVSFDEKYIDLYNEICKEWEKITKLELEFGDYSKMIIRDVNNYIAVDTDGNVKRKGAFCWKVPKEIDYHKNPSFTIIPKAVDNYFVNGIPVEETINNTIKENDIFPFLGAVKKKRDFNLNIYELKNGNVNITKQQKVTRFYISKTGGKLAKDYHSGKLKGRRTLVMADWYLTTLNKITDETLNHAFNNLNLTYYVKEAKDRIYEIEKDNKQLRLF